MIVKIVLTSIKNPIKLKKASSFWYKSAMEASMLQNVPLKPRNYNYFDHKHKPLTNYFDIVDSASLYALVKSFPQ